MSNEAQTEKEIMQLLRTEAKRTSSFERSRRCPDEHLIAAYADGGLTEEDRSAVEAHIADCAVCLEDVAISARLGDGSSRDETIPDRLQARLEALGETIPVWHRWLSWKTAGAVAASAVLVVLFLVKSDSETVKIQPSAGYEQVQRTDRVSYFRPSITLPSEGAEVTRESLEFRWVGPDALTYDVEVVGDSGTLIWSQTVKGDTIVPPDSVVLESGRQYYVSVIARGVGGRTVRSKFVGFRISDR
jgi:hypothetical protein